MNYKESEGKFGLLFARLSLSGAMAAAAAHNPTNEKQTNQTN